MNSPKLHSPECECNQCVMDGGRWWLTEYDDPEPQAEVDAALEMSREDRNA